MDIIKSIEHEQLKSKVPDIKVGDTIRVHQRIKEGNRERIQVFEGIVIKKQNGGLNETFTVRRVAYGVGVEKTFLLHSPLVEKVELVRVGKVRRAKLYYLRDRIGKAAKTKENIGADLKRDELVVKEEMPVQEAPTETESANEVAEANAQVDTEKVAEATVEDTTAQSAEETVAEKAEVKETAQEEKVEAKAETKEVVAEKVEEKANDTEAKSEKEESADEESK